MKLIYTLLLAVFTALQINAQTAQQHQAPPTNNFPYTRAMFVDCTDDIVADIRNGNPLASLDELKTYIRENFIGMISLYDLDHGKVIGNPALEPSFRIFLRELRHDFPQLKIGIVGRKYDYTLASGSMRASDYFSRNCRSNGNLYTQHQLDSLINSVQNYSDLQRSETIKFFLRAIKFSKQFGPNSCNPCRSAFDVFYLEDPYWKDASSNSMAVVKSRFETFKLTLNVLQLLKCACPNISIETEFDPTDFFRLSGWTATDQIEQADPLIDRMMIPFYTSPYNANGAYDINCRLLHLLSDQFSRDGTTFYCGFSAQSNSFNFCNSPNIPLEHLGRYLAGTIGMASGNMYSVEQAFLDKLNDPLYMCAGCSCFEYSENQYSTSNPTANKCSGSVWYPYSMLKNNGLFRKSSLENSNELITNLNASEMNLKLQSNTISSFQLFDTQGRVVKKESVNAINHTIDLSGLSAGIYILSVKTLEGKQFSRSIPLLNR